jgi:ADP-heptose:LPS heptosyltransferase
MNGFIHWHIFYAKRLILFTANDRQWPMNTLNYPASILIYTDGEVIGDGIIRLPFAMALKKAFPHATLTWLASGYSVFESSLNDLAAPIIDEIIIIPDRTIPWIDFLRRPAILRHRKFDLIIDGQRKVKRSLWLARIQHRCFVSAAANGWLSSVPLAARQDRFIDQLFFMARAATQTHLTPPPLIMAEPWLKAAAEVLPDGPSYVGFIVGAGHPDKCWPLNHFIALAQQQVAHGRVPVIFLGPLETALAALIHTHVPLTETSPLCVARTHPCFTIALGARMAATVANDSGGGHLMAAGGSPMVSLFRSATVRKKFMPTTARVIALAPEDFAGTAMPAIAYEAVNAALETLLGADTVQKL